MSAANVSENLVFSRPASEAILGSVRHRLGGGEGICSLSVGGSALFGAPQGGNIPLLYFDVTGKRCTTQEALYHFFGIPPEVLTEPRVWYARHRRPYILEFSPDRTRVLVSFESSTLSRPIIGICLYACRQEGGDVSTAASKATPVGGWGAYAVRPNASHSLEEAERWLVKRKWKSWC